MPTTETQATLGEQADLLERQISTLEEIQDDEASDNLGNAIARAKEAVMWLREAAEEDGED